MLFNSITYALFLPIVFILYWSLPVKLRNPLLLIASYYFYMSWNYKLVALILATTLISYLAARFIGAGFRYKKTILVIAVSACLGILVFYKYFNFLFNTLHAFMAAIAMPIDSIALNLLLPVGISFYTFQTLSYVIDVYRGKILPEKNFFTYALYVSFFPQLVAGPIERPDTLIPQFKTKHIFNYDGAVYGAKMIAVGMFKKVVVADTMAEYVDPIYNQLTSYDGFALILATVLFAVQIYCDFSGYSDIAIGSAKLLGFDLMQNFKTPYLATSIKDFWGRWHLSLSGWFRDYVYIPLGGNRVGNIRLCINLMLTFLLSGLWHGAATTFVVWGAYHGLLNIIQTFLSKQKVSFTIPTILSRAITFVLVCVGWVFFRVASIGDSIYIFQHLFTGVSDPINYILKGAYSLDISNIHSLLQLLLPLIAIIFIDLLDYKQGFINRLSSVKAPLRYPVYLILVYVPIYYFIGDITSGVEQAFLYFQF